ncbi:MAG: hypothetical protein LH471_02380, partial [Salinibacterium sp.]|nr:hypothetical protein [Salinibacterium sp.]
MAYAASNRRTDQTGIAFPTFTAEQVDKALDLMSSWESHPGSEPEGRARSAVCRRVFRRGAV